MSWFNRIRERLSRFVEESEATQDVSTERQEEILDKLSKQVLTRGLEVPAIIFLECVKPLSYIGGQFAYFLGSPYYDALGAGFLTDYIKTLENRENLERLLVKIEEGIELDKAEEAKRKAEKIKSEMDRDTNEENYLSKLKKWIRK